MGEAYPERGIDRDRWIVSRRGPRNKTDPFLPQGYFLEDERAANGEVVPVATIFLTNRECPWRCVMCDLWRYTTTETVPSGAIPAQIYYALTHLPSARQIKLYNSGSFFDPRAIPRDDHAAIAAQLRNFERVIVECHPALVNDDCVRFRDLLDSPLEIAMGLETVHPEVLPRLNKRMSLADYQHAADFLARHDVALRSFILVKPPFVAAGEAVRWAQRSLDFAIDCGATAATVIPTRAGNGAMEVLHEAGDFAPPSLYALEAAAEYGVGKSRTRVFADTWDIEKLDKCPQCAAGRIDRLRVMNLTQVVPPAVRCPCQSEHV